MNNKEFLQSIYNRMLKVHLESPNVDYMIRFKETINQYPVETVVQYKPEIIKETTKGSNIDLSL